MQRLAGNFIIKRSFVSYGDGGNMVELYELLNGQWQFGKGRDATVITTMEQISMVSDPVIRKDIEAWIEKTKGIALQAVQQGQPALVSGMTSKSELIDMVTHMTEGMCGKLVEGLKQIVGPELDSLRQQSQTNHYSDGFGQDQDMVPPAATPFVLPAGAKWAQDGHPESGYLAPDLTVKDEKGQSPMRWHPTPQFTQFVDTAPERTDIEIEMAAEREKHQERELVGAGSGRTRSRRR